MSRAAPSPFIYVTERGPSDISRKTLDSRLRGNDGPPCVACRASGALLDEPRIGQRVEIRHLLDDADFEEQVGGFLAELLELAGEELLVRSPILPAQVLLRRLELFARLLDVGPHDLEALLRLLRDHVDRIEVAVGERLRRLRVVGE